MSVSIPNSITIDVPLDVRLDANAAVQAAMTADARMNAVGALTMTLLGDRNQPVSADITVLGDKEHPVSLAAAVDASLMLKNLPILTFEQIEKLIDRMKPRARIRAPFHFKFGVSVFPLNLWGVDALQLSLCGEPQLIIQDYVGDGCEPCEVDCDPCRG